MDKLMTLSRDRRSGMSLLEVMIATVIFSIVILGVVKGLVFARRLSENNVWRASALTVAAGYLEQMRAMTLNDLVEAAGTPPEEIPTEVNQGSGDPLWPNSWPAASGDSAVNRKTVDVNDTPSNEGDDMVIEFNPQLSLVDDANGSRIVIRLDYRWEPPEFRGVDSSRWPTGTLHLIRSRIPNS